MQLAGCRATAKHQTRVHPGGGCKLLAPPPNLPVSLRREALRLAPLEPSRLQQTFWALRAEAMSGMCSPSLTAPLDRLLERFHEGQRVHLHRCKLCSRKGGRAGCFGLLGEAAPARRSAGAWLHGFSAWSVPELQDVALSPWEPVQDAPVDSMQPIWALLRPRCARQPGCESIQPNVQVRQGGNCTFQPSKGFRLYDPSWILKA